MYSAIEKAVENIPVEGRREYTHKGEKISFSEDMITEIVESFFERKSPPLKKKAVLMMGAPGAGKTHFSHKILEAMEPSEAEGFVFVGYNEGGAESEFKPFQRELAQADTPAQRLDVAKKYQPVTQLIQNSLLRAAILREQSLWIDITAAGRGAGFLIETLRKAGYETIDLIALYAPFDISAKRATERQRPAEFLDDIVGKRTGVLGFYEAHAAKCNTARFYYNPDDAQAPIEMFNMKEGRVSDILNSSAIHAFFEGLSEDVAAVRGYLKSLKENGQYPQADFEKMMEAYEQATKTAVDFAGGLLPYQTVRVTSHPQAPTNS